MAGVRSIGARPDAVRGTTAIEVRKGLSGLIVPASSGPLGARPGVLGAGAVQLVAGSGGWSYLVGAFNAVLSRSAGDGVHISANDGQVSVGVSGVGDTVPAAPGSGLSRVDRIWVRQASADENGDTTSDVVFGVAVGAAASMPVPPAIPAGALELARNTMTSGATSTSSSGNSIEQTFPRTALRGVTVNVRDASELAQLESVATAYDPVRAYRIDTRQHLVHAGLGWVPVTEGVAMGRVQLVSGLTGPDNPLTGVITVPALPVDYRVIAIATGRCGGVGADRDVAWDFDTLGSYLSASEDDYERRVRAHAGVYASVTHSIEIVQSRTVATTMRLVLRGTGDAYSTGSVTWWRAPL